MGGYGADQFVFFDYKELPDRIRDFEKGLDHIVIHTSGFLNQGISNITYNSSNGELFWNPFGNDVNDHRLIATINNHAEFGMLAASDFTFTA